MFELVVPILAGVGVIFLGASIRRDPHWLIEINRQNTNRWFGQWSWTTYWMTFDSEWIERSGDSE